MPIVIALEDLMPRFYFDLASKDEHITDDGGKDLDTLNDAYDYARKLIDKILLYVGYDNADTWKVIISNDEHDAQMIVPFAGRDVFRALREGGSAILGGTDGGQGRVAARIESRNIAPNEVITG